jgi:hypothetical protein
MFPAIMAFVVAGIFLVAFFDKSKAKEELDHEKN